MALQKTKVLNITSVTGVSTVGILTAGVTTTDAGVAGTCYIRSVIMHNTGLGTARVSLYINPDTNPVTSTPVVANRILRIDVAPNETTFFESNYPIILTPTDSLGVDVTPPDAGGVGIGSAVNFLVNGDTDI
nr:hypothetical protein [uncultured Mediterranean phage uvMED]